MRILNIWPICRVYSIYDIRIIRQKREHTTITNLEVVGEVVAAREPLVAVRAGVVPRARVLGHVALPVGLVGELQAALVADEGLDAAVRAHVRVEQRLP